MHEYSLSHNGPKHRAKVKKIDIDLVMRIELTPAILIP